MSTDIILNPNNVLSGKKREILFLLFNFLFWFLHCSFFVFLFPAEKLKNFVTITVHILQYLTPFLCTLLLRDLYKRYKVYQMSFWWILPIVILTSILCGLLYYAARELLNYYFLNVLWYNFKSFSLMEMMWSSSYMFLTWSVMYLGFKAYNEWMKQKKFTENALLLAKTAQLEMLKHQLNPHFLFNSLSALRGMIIPEPVKAKEMVTQISEILRYSLIEGKNDMVPLIREIEIVKLYLSIEKKRFEEDLIVDFDILPEAKDFMIPIFLIHPLVENAVKHGMQSGVLPLNIAIKINSSQNTLFIEVKNRGKWIENNVKSGSSNTGTGLDNINKRLSLYYPGNYTFVIIKDPEYVSVKIKINY